MLGCVGFPRGLWSQYAHSSALAILSARRRRRCRGNHRLRGPTHARVAPGRLPARHLPLAHGQAGAAIPWCSPDPRAILDLDRFHVPRRLQRTCRGGQFTATLDQDFAGVIRGCATAGGRGRTWLIPPMIRAYTELFLLGHAHSVEVWHERQACGRDLWRGDCRAVRRRVDVPPCPRRLEGGLGPLGLPSARARLYATGHSATHAARRAVRRRRDFTSPVPAPARPCPDRSGSVSQ